ncbi:MAG TPA: LysR family transcriptional regulator [Gaiellaceae bacterium]|nr:LysR family transcriptional regulator [Gaiellaceae bacterium]
MAGEHWFGIELRHLAALDAVAREGSFRRAAERLGYVQSAISHQIAALEGITGRRLVDRSRGTRPIALTAAGVVLLAHADAVIARMRDAQADLAALDGGGATTLRVGSTQDVAARVVPRVLAAFARVRAEVTVTLQASETSERVVGLVARGDVDLAFAELPLRNAALDGVPLYYDPFVVLVQASSALARRAKGVGPATVVRLPLIAHAPTRSEVEMGLRARGLEPQFVLESDAGATVQALVAAGLGAAIIPRSAVDEATTETTVVALDPPTAIAGRVVALVWNRERRLRKDAAAFVDAARSVCVEIDASHAVGRNGAQSSLLCA